MLRSEFTSWAMVVTVALIGLLPDDLLPIPRSFYVAIVGITLALATVTVWTSWSGKDHSPKWQISLVVCILAAAAALAVPGASLPLYSLAFFLGLRTATVILAAYVSATHPSVEMYAGEILPRYSDDPGLSNATALWNEDRFEGLLERGQHLALAAGSARVLGIDAGSSRRTEPSSADTDHALHQVQYELGAAQLYIQALRDKLLKANETTETALDIADSAEQQRQFTLEELEDKDRELSRLGTTLGRDRDQLIMGFVGGLRGRSTQGFGEDLADTFRKNEKLFWAACREVGDVDRGVSASSPKPFRGSKGVSEAHVANDHRLYFTTHEGRRWYLMLRPKKWQRKDSGTRLMKSRLTQVGTAYSPTR